MSAGQFDTPLDVRGNDEMAQVIHGLESLRNRLSVKGVAVVTIKPGPVKTPMLGDRKMPLTVSAEVAARRIAVALERGEHTVYVHWGYRLIMGVIRCIPHVLFRRMAI